MNPPERPREYALDPGRYELALLTELRARVADQIKDLDEATGNLRPPNTKNSIHFLVWHMCDAEGRWLSTFDPSLKPQYESIFREAFTKDDFIPRASLDAVFESSRRMLEGYRASANPRSIPARFGHERAALAHLHWHWTYHSGQVGLMRVMLGHPYSWKFRE
jgi:uncharacterized damage-inducible protein DinB